MAQGSKFFTSDQIILPMRGVVFKLCLIANAVEVELDTYGAMSERRPRIPKTAVPKATAVPPQFEDDVKKRIGELGHRPPSANPKHFKSQHYEGAAPPIGEDFFQQRAYTDSLPRVKGEKQMGFLKISGPNEGRMYAENQREASRFCAKVEHGGQQNHQLAGMRINWLLVIGENRDIVMSLHSSSHTQDINSDDVLKTVEAKISNALLDQNVGSMSVETAQHVAQRAIYICGQQGAAASFTSQMSAKQGPTILAPHKALYTECEIIVFYPEDTERVMQSRRTPHVAAVEWKRAFNHVKRSGRNVKIVRGLSGRNRVWVMEVTVNLPGVMPDNWAEQPYMCSTKVVKVSHREVDWKQENFYVGDAPIEVDDEKALAALQNKRVEERKRKVEDEHAYAAGVGGEALTD